MQQYTVPEACRELPLAWLSHLSSLRPCLFFVHQKKLLGRFIRFSLFSLSLTLKSFGIRHDCCDLLGTLILFVEILMKDKH